MIWSHEHKKEIATFEWIVFQLQTIRKELKMDFTIFDAALAKLSSDISTELADAQAAILAAQSNPADVTHLAAAAAALANIDAAVAAADAAFKGTVTTTATGTSTVPVPPTI